MLERENSLLAPDSIYSILYPVVLADSQTRLTRDLALDGTSLYIRLFTCLYDNIRLFTCLYDNIRLFTCLYDNIWSFTSLLVKEYNKLWE
jgi:hypothetical protein